MASQLLDGIGLSVVELYPRLEIVLGILDSRFVRIAPSCERSYNKISDILGDFPMVFGSFLHLGSHSIVSL